MNYHLQFYLCMTLNSTNKTFKKNKNIKKREKKKTQKWNKSMKIQFSIVWFDFFLLFPHSRMFDFIFIGIIINLNNNWDYNENFLIILIFWFVLSDDIEWM